MKGPLEGEILRVAACREILGKLEILHGKKVARGSLVELVFVVRSVMYS